MTLNTRMLARRVTRLALLPIVALSLVACVGDAPAATPQATVSSAPTGGTQGSTAVATVAMSSGTATTPVEQPGATVSTGLMDLMTVGEPCALLTKQEVESILGPVDYENGSSVSSSSVRSPARLACDYVLSGFSGGTHLSIALESPMNWVAYSRYEGGAQVGGIGDDAYAYDENNERKLWVLVNRKAVINVVLNPTDLEKAKQLAGKIIEKLP